MHINNFINIKLNKYILMRDVSKILFNKIKVDKILIEYEIKFYFLQKKLKFY